MSEKSTAAWGTLYTIWVSPASRRSDTIGGYRDRTRELNCCFSCSTSAWDE